MLQALEYLSDPDRRGEHLSRCAPYVTLRGYSGSSAETALEKLQPIEDTLGGEDRAGSLGSVQPCRGPLNCHAGQSH